MRKMKTVFAVDYDNGVVVTREVRPENDWVVRGEGRATIKFDGTAAAVIGGRLYKRWDRKLKPRFWKLARIEGEGFKPSPEMFKDVPPGAIPCEEKADPKTFHFPHWVPVSDSSEDVWFREALEGANGLVEGATYELVGPKVQNNLYGLDKHELWMHGSLEVVDLDRSFEGIREWLAENNHEGIVFHHEDGRMAKIRRKDFGIKWG